MGTTPALWLLLPESRRGLSAGLVLCWGMAAMQLGAAQNGQEDMVQGVETLLWPIHFSSMPLSTPEKASLETPEFGAELAKIGMNCFRRYKDTILPKELELDKRFAAEFAVSDHSRVNFAFMRWQKRVFAERNGISPEDLTGRGDIVPKLKGIDYSWPEFYDNPLYKQLIKRFTQVAKLYLKRTGYTDPEKYRIFTWAEVFQEGDAQRPWARTDGAYVMGRYFAKAKKFALKFNFEDPRGVNPPFGKTYSHAAFQGNLVMFPTWVSHFITPNMFNSTQVCFGFLVYPQDGNQALDWEDDLTGKVEVQHNLYIPMKGQKAIVS